MKYSVIALALVATTASADMTQPTMAQSVNGTVQDHYQTVTRQIPHTERVTLLVIAMLINVVLNTKQKL